MMDILTKMIGLTAGVFIILLAIGYFMVYRIIKITRKYRKVLKHKTSEIMLLRRKCKRSEMLNTFMFTFLMDLVTREPHDIEAKLNNIRIYVQSLEYDDNPSETLKLYHDAMFETYHTSQNKIYDALMKMFPNLESVYDMSADTIEARENLVDRMAAIRNDISKQEVIVHNNWMKASKIYNKYAK